MKAEILNLLNEDARMSLNDLALRPSPFCKAAKSEAKRS